MCVLIHKPAGITVPGDLLRAAAALNSDGFGLMGITEAGQVLVHRQPRVDVSTLGDRLDDLRTAELALHLRRRTYGGRSACNAHPFEIDDGVYLMHNGELRLPVQNPEHSDTWHFVSEVLRPIARRWPGLVGSKPFARLLDTVLAPDNRMVLFDTRSKQIHVANRRAGFEYQGLWVSSARWLDSRLFQVPGNAHPLPAVVDWG